MRVFYYLGIFGLLPLVTLAQSSNQIVIGQIDSLQSKILHEKRKIWVHIPQSYQDSTYSKRRYPVVYLLDAEAHFSSVAGMIDQLSAVNGNMVCPEMIVVGIPNTDRTRDLTPTPGSGLVPSPMDSVLRKTSGGGENFTHFMERELIPRVDSLYPTQPYRMFVGHSFGGLLVINTLIHHPNLFTAYVAIDPSMWWNNRKLLKEAQAALSTQKYSNKSLFIGIANTVLASGMDTLQVQKDTTAATNHLRSILALHHLLLTNRQNGLRYKGHYYATDSHGSVPLISEYDALHFIFEDYSPTLTAEDFSTDDVLFAQKIATHFAKVSAHWGFPVKPPEEMVNSFGYTALSQKQYKRAASLFKLNVTNYPDSYSAYDAYGTLLLAEKDMANALANFQKSLTLKETADTRQKLMRLQATVQPKTSSETKQRQ